MNKSFSGLLKRMPKASPLCNGLVRLNIKVPYIHHGEEACQLDGEIIEIDEGGSTNIVQDGSSVTQLNIKGGLTGEISNMTNIGNTDKHLFESNNLENDGEKSNISPLIDTFVDSKKRINNFGYTQVNQQLFVKPFDENVFQFNINDTDGKVEVVNTSGVSPYDVYNYTYKGSTVKREQINKGLDKRISVTGLLSKRWCELKSYYDIYSKFKKFQSVEMIRGTAGHQALELESHPIDTDFMQQVAPVQPKSLTAEDIYANYVFDSIEKLTSLLLTGEARELKIHSFIDKETGELLRPENYKVHKLALENDTNMLGGRYILVTGVIDHLILQGDHLELDSGELIKSFDDIINYTEQHEVDRQLVVADVKLRFVRSLPSQESVIEAAKLQVGIYRKMLAFLSSNNSFHILKEAARRQAVDIDAPLTPQLVAVLAEHNSFVRHDCEQLAKGKALEIPFSEYSWASFLNDPTFTAALPNSVHLFCVWKQPMTLRSLLHRFSQLLESLARKKTSNLLIEYYHEGKKFEEISFEYNEQAVSSQVKSNIDLWLGRRPPEPILPSYHNIKTYCKSCEYREMCHWKKYYRDKSRNVLHGANNSQN